MTYTYDNVIEEARKAGVLDKFTDADHSTAQKNADYGMSLVGLMKDANNATTETQRLLAMETMNQLRKSYGTTGAITDAAGSSFAGTQRLVAPEVGGTLASSDPTTYQTVLDDIVNQKEFTYDPETDPIYAAYAKAYRREGRRASENALAQAAAMTGGRPSSYAISAAQQAGNYYASQLADMIPTLRQNAKAEYDGELSTKYDILNALQAKKQDDENRKRLAIQDALTKYQVLGYATPDVAEVLGIAPGIPKGQYDVANESSTADGTVKFLVGDSWLTQGKIDEAVAANAITANYDVNTGKVTYSWVQGMEEEFLSEATIGNPMGGAGEYTWVQIGDDKISLPALEREVEAGRIVGRYDASSNTVTYERIALPGRTGR